MMIIMMTALTVSVVGAAEAPARGAAGVGRGAQGCAPPVALWGIRTAGGERRMMMFVVVVVMMVMMMMDHHEYEYEYDDDDDDDDDD
jgi:hypothetical protein